MPVPYADVEAWARLRGLVLAAWELDALNEMDLARRSSLRPPDEGSPSKLRRSVSMSDTKAAMDLFDRFRRNND